MVLLERFNPIFPNMEPTSSPRISFSGGDFVIGEKNIDHDLERVKTNITNSDFEFLSGKSSTEMLPADELFSEGRILPFCQLKHVDTLNEIIMKPKEQDEKKQHEEVSSSNINWFIDDDPSPRPPKCTVLWKELLKLKRQNSSHLASPVSSSSPSSGELSTREGKGEKEGSWSREKHVKRIKKGLERTRSNGVSIRPLFNVPGYTQGRNNSVLNL